MGSSVDTMGKEAAVGRVDRAVQRVRRHLDADEALLCSAWGIEADGRRRRVVVVTDRRVVVGWRRPAPPDELGLNTTAAYERSESRLTLTDGDVVVRLVQVDPVDARQVVNLLDRQHARPLAERIGDPFHVRILGA